MRPLEDELRDVFTQSWRPEDEEAVSWKDDITAYAPLNVPLQGHVIRQLAGRELQVLPLLRQDKDEVWTYTQSRWLVYVLGQFDGGVLALQRLASDEGGPYCNGRDEDAAHLLAARNDRQHFPFFRSLVLNRRISSTVQKIALQALVNANDTDSIKALQTLSWWSDDIPLARVRLGDMTALRPLIQSRTSDKAHQAIAALEERLGGLTPLLNELISVNPEALQEPNADPMEQLAHLALHDPMVEVQAWAIRQLATRARQRFSGLVPALLQHRAWQTLTALSDVLASIQPPPAEELNAILKARERPRSMRLWAALTLLRANLQPDLSDLEDVRIALPPEVPQDARDAIVHYWVRVREGVEAGTDVRWLIEGYTFGWDWPDVTEEHEAVVAAIQREGLTTTAPVEAGVWHQQGSGNYVILEVEGQPVWISEIARFVWTSHPQAATWAALRPRLEQALAPIGWKVLSEEAAGVVFPGLNVYYFARRTSQPLRNLLFYWQD
ncbi:hypothetical protein [Deinococcus radiotolerans]|uniref:Uncharacterized protein n=1 Tax=Deinococcus radiotolerans TaxID=1309407 RepID=A0ABQ2FR56_9DEIO|nr:hypothetical protein [Deinococcus radiotolerans]GGL18525.1 hypothetical protein GCM10010844_41710 [Deinococcus radiotolerans]